MYVREKLRRAKKEHEKSRAREHESAKAKTQKYKTKKRARKRKREEHPPGGESASVKPKKSTCPALETAITR
jgi:hypothetical protein